MYDSKMIVQPEEEKQRRSEEEEKTQNYVCNNYDYLQNTLCLHCAILSYNISEDYYFHFMHENYLAPFYAVKYLTST